MPQNLDSNTQNTVLAVSTFTTVTVLIFVLKGQLFTIRKLRKQCASLQPSSPPSLLAGCIYSLAIMSLFSFLITRPVVAYRLEDDETELILSQRHLSSSINFCEEDFKHSRHIAEPANVASSLGSYVPLALLGLVGPPSKQLLGHSNSGRFFAAYATLFTIGVGSMALHATLSAAAQGGDELPMLWYTAAVSYCAIDVILFPYTTTTTSPKKKRSSSWLGSAVAASAVAATAMYVMNRSDFTVFYLMFSVYTQILIASVLWISLGLKWEQKGGAAFCVSVLMPLAVSCGYMTVVAIWTWVAEMLYCHAMLQQDGGWVAPLIWNRVLHPFWHQTSGILAWLLVQVLVAAHGMQQQWGVPTLRWFGAPYVAFVEE